MADGFGTFVVDHEKLQRGIYLGRKDKLPGGHAYTLDIRVAQPYVDEVIPDYVCHSIEHIVATRMEEYYKGKAVQKLYFGPMGCQTGFYAVVFVPDAVEEQYRVANFLGRAFKSFCEKVTEVPFNSRKECGNCTTLASSFMEIMCVNSYLDDMRKLFEDLEVRGWSEYPYL